MLVKSQFMDACVVPNKCGTPSRMGVRQVYKNMMRARARARIMFFRYTILTYLDPESLEWTLVDSHTVTAKENQLARTLAMRHPGSHEDTSRTPAGQPRGLRGF